MISFWNHVRLAPQSSLISQVYNYHKEMDVRGIHSFHTTIKNILSQCGIQIASQNIPEHTIMNKISKSLAQYLNDSVQNTLQNLSDNTGKLTLYKQLKHNNKYETYLSTVTNTQHRRALTQLRMSTHKLPIETGRYIGIPRDQRLCQLCSLNE